MSYEDKLKVYNILCNIVIRGGGGFGPVWGYVEGNISFNIMARGGGGFYPSRGKIHKCNILFNIVFRGGGRFGSDSFFLVSDSRVLVSDSLLLIRGQFLIRGLFHYKWPCSIAMSMLNYQRANKT